MLTTLRFACRSSCRYRPSLKAVKPNVSNSRFLASSTLINDLEAEELEKKYQQLIDRRKSRLSMTNKILPDGVFANREVEMKEIEVVGFDYDYTLAVYTSALDELIFNQVRDNLVKLKQYPKEIGELKYDPNFLIRGLHYDVQRGNIFKVDSFHNIQVDTVHNALDPVPEDDVLRTYNGTYLSSRCLKQYLVPDMMKHLRIPFHPRHVFLDVSQSVSALHRHSEFASAIMSDPSAYIHRDPKLVEYLNQLRHHGKRIFVITNSSSSFIDRGMRYLIGDSWRELFDVVITQAKKPTFFQAEGSEFRLVTTQPNWERVTCLQRGKVYEGGCIAHLHKLTQWDPQTVLYFGDHVYSDLADVANTYGWLTGAVIPELEREIGVINNTDHYESTLRLREIEGLLDYYQHAQTPAGKSLIEAWRDERNELRVITKSSFNPHFGSIFRSFHNPSYFSRRLQQYAIFYTSNVCNLLRFPLNHVFYPKRTALPHEVPG